MENLKLKVEDGMNIDYKSHNDEVREVWKSYREGKPIRVPMILGLTERSYLSDPKLNKTNISYYDYHNNPDIMMDVQLKFQDFVRHHIRADHEMGLPDMWTVRIDAGNYHHSAWYGCTIHYSNQDSPDTKRILQENNKNMLFDRGIPDPFSGIYARIKEMHAYMLEKVRNFAYKGIPIKNEINVPAANISGNGVPFTTACKLRGTSEMCMDMVLHPDYAKQLLEYVTDAFIARTKAWRKYLDMPVKTDNVFLGDDSVILLSPDMYREFVLPCHKRIYEEFGTPDAVRGIHLCGRASKHFEVLKKELNVTVFDTGFPVNLPELYRQLGEEIRIRGGLHIELLRTGSTEEIERESRKILEDVKPYKNFIFRDANHLAPCTPVENLNAMYEACRKYGRY